MFSNIDLAQELFTVQTQDKIIQSLQVLNPTHTQLINESMNHAGYFEGKESHFKLTIVSEAFENKRLVARHQSIYALVDALMTSQGGSIHALAIHAYTPAEWGLLNKNNGNVPQSPLCAGTNAN